MTKIGNPKPSTIIWIILGNVVPVFGVIFMGWSVFHIMLLYWFECLLIGITEVLQTLVQTSDKTIFDSGSIFNKLKKWGAQLASNVIGFLILVFIFSLFVAMYGMAIVQSLSDEKLSVPESLIDHPAAAGIVGIMGYIFGSSLKWAALVSIVTHLKTVVLKSLKRRRQGLPLFKPDPAVFFGRVLLLQLIVGLGSLGIHALDSPLAMLLLLVVVKMIAELALRLTD